MNGVPAGLHSRRHGFQRLEAQQRGLCLWHRRLVRSPCARGREPTKAKCWASQAACMCRCDAAEKRQRHKARKPAGRAHGFVRMRCIHTYIHRCCRRYERAGFSHFEDDGWASFTHSANSGNCHVHDFAEPTYIHTSKYLRGPYVCMYMYHHVTPYMYVLGPRLPPPQQERVSRPKGDMTSDGDHCFSLPSSTSTTMYVLVLTHSSQLIPSKLCSISCTVSAEKEDQVPNASGRPQHNTVVQVQGHSTRLIPRPQKQLEATKHSGEQSTCASGGKR